MISNPSFFPQHPTARKGCTKIVSNDRGHLFAEVPRSKESPWGNFKGTWDDHLGLQKNRTSPIKPKKTKSVVENTQNVIECETENVPVVVERQQTAEPEKATKRVQIQE